MRRVVICCEYVKKARRKESPLGHFPREIKGVNTKGVKGCFYGSSASLDADFASNNDSDRSR